MGLKDTADVYESSRGGIASYDQRRQEALEALKKHEGSFIVCLASGTPDAPEGQITMWSMTKAYHLQDILPALLGLAQELIEESE